jgi:hypothetical protein
MYINKTSHNIKVGVKETKALTALERGGRVAAAASVVRAFAGVVGNGVSRARCITFVSMLLREEVLAGGAALDAAADFRPVDFLAGGGEGAVLGSFF